MYRAPNKRRTTRQKSGSEDPPLQGRRGEESRARGYVPERSLHCASAKIADAPVGMTNCETGLVDEGEAVGDELGRDVGV